MKYLKSMLCLLLAVLCLIPCVSGAAAGPAAEGQVMGHGAPASMARPLSLPTEEDLTTSAAGLEFIKSHEGYSAYAYGDNTQTSIGYGCSTAYAEKYGFSTTYLSRADAHDLLVCVVWEFESSLDSFLRTYALVLDQAQYDALISFTFNLGTGWLSGCRLTRALINGYTVNQFASAMGIWCHVGSDIVEGLVNRRIDEILLFLYGAYSPEETDRRFCTLRYDGQGTFENDIDFFLAGEPYGGFSAVTPPDASLYFAGWYTLGGARITEETVVSEDLTVYARWSQAPLPEGGYEIKGLKLLDGSNEPLAAIPDTGFYAEAEIYKGRDSGEAVVLIAVYTAGGQLLDTHYLRANVPAGTTYSLGAWIANDDGSAGSVKAFVLSSLEDAEPLCQAAEIS